MVGPQVVQRDDDEVQSFIVNGLIAGSATRREECHRRNLGDEKKQSRFLCGTHGYLPLLTSILPETRPLLANKTQNGRLGLWLDENVAVRLLAFIT
jgi:hypothetical protein